MFSGNVGFFALLRNACTKSGSLRFYEFWLSLCKIVRSSVILLLPLFKQYVTGNDFVLLYKVFYRKQFYFVLHGILPGNIFCFTRYFTENGFVLFYIVFYQKRFLFYTVFYRKRILFYTVLYRKRFSFVLHCILPETFFVLHGILPEAFLIYFTRYFIGTVLSVDLFPRQKTSNSLIDPNC